MSKWTYEYEDAIPQSDRDVLEAKKDAILAALIYAPIFWELHIDSQGRSHYRAVAYSNHSDVLCQFILDDIANLDGQQLTNRMIAGDFRERDIP